MSSIKRAISVVDLLARKGPLGVRSVAKQLNLPLGSVHRLLLDLAEEAWSSARRRRLGAFVPAAARSPACTSSASPSRDLARPFCERIAAGDAARR